jgi:hypothetical protein
VGSSWMLGRVGMGKLLMRVSGDGVENDVMLDWQGWTGSSM